MRRNQHGNYSGIDVHSGDVDSPITVVIFAQHDGYPKGIGKRTFDALRGRRFTDGIADAKRDINGMGCAAALLVAHLKGDKAGGIYLEPPDAKGWRAEYHYRIFQHIAKREIWITASEEGDRAPFYTGPIAGFGDAIERPAPPAQVYHVFYAGQFLADDEKSWTANLGEAASFTLLSKARQIGERECGRASFEVFARTDRG